MATSFACHAITTVWSMVEVFLGIKESIAMSQTCHSLYDTIIDADTQEVKVSHFKLGYDGHRESILPLLPLALECVHFPSLRKLEIDLTDRANPEAYMSLFSRCVANLADAHNLESFQFTFWEGVFSVVNANDIALSWIKTFGKNLAKCRKLKDLIVNFFQLKNVEVNSACVGHMINALIPTLRKRKDTLKVLDFETNFSCDDSKKDFFVAVLGLKNLKDLRIDVSSKQMTDSLLEATAWLSPHTAKPTGIKHLKLQLSVAENDAYSFAPLLEYYTECHSMEDIKLRLPKMCWEDRVSFLAWTKLITNKPKLTLFNCHFDSHKDSDDKVMNVLEDFVSGHERTQEIRVLEIRRLDDVDHKRLIKMKRLFEDKCMIWNVVQQRQTENYPGRADIDYASHVEEQVVRR